MYTHHRLQDCELNQLCTIILLQKVSLAATYCNFLGVFIFISKARHASAIKTQIVERSALVCEIAKNCIPIRKRRTIIFLLIQSIYHRYADIRSRITVQTKYRPTLLQFSAILRCKT